MNSFQGDERLLKPPSRLWLVLCAALTLAGIGFLVAFGRAQYGYLRSERYYTQLSETVKIATAENADAQTIGTVDFAALRAENAEAAAWLEVPGAGVSLPVVQPQDNSTYLHTGFDGSASQSGCLFFSALAPESTLYRVIYGHNLHDGTMFGQLTAYQDAAHCAEYPTFTLETPDGRETYRIFSCHSVTDGDDLYQTAREAGEEYDAFLQTLIEASDYDTGVTPPSGAQVVTLSTCATAYTAGTTRFVVHGYRES